MNVLGMLATISVVQHADRLQTRIAGELARIPWVVGGMHRFRAFLGDCSVVPEHCKDYSRMNRVTTGAGKKGSPVKNC